MIKIAGKVSDADTAGGRYEKNSVQRLIVNDIAQAGKTFSFSGTEQFDFEVEMRTATVNCALELYKSGMEFAVFRKSKCNTAFWDRENNGGFKLKHGVLPSAAITDIIVSGNKYATECATAIVIVYYLAVHKVWPQQVFDSVFKDITLMNWHDIDPVFRGIGIMADTDSFIPGDRMYFANPDVNPATPQWQGENVIVLPNGGYYGHGIGIYDADFIISELNKNRAGNSGKSAYLMHMVGRPNYSRLFMLSSRTGDAA